uniref:Amine oxidase domain-containing protein n=1 Tax=Tetranychus urticae TaxID=32264 RepID=T1JS20_TETUR
MRNYKIFLEFNESLCPKFIDSALTEIIICWLPQDLENMSWASKMYSISKIGDRCLMVWLSGEEAQTIEKMDFSKLKSDLINAVKKILKAPDLPDPVNIIPTRWHQDPFSRGSYSFISAQSCVGDIEKLAQPIYSNPAQEKPNLLFAGEACHTSYFSTTHGAFLTGRKAALYLVDSDENSIKEVDPSKKLCNL